MSNINTKAQLNFKCETTEIDCSITYQRSLNNTTWQQVSSGTLDPQTEKHTKWVERK